MLTQIAVGRYLQQLRYQLASAGAGSDCLVPRPLSSVPRLGLQRLWRAIVQRRGRRICRQRAQPSRLSSMALAPSPISAGRPAFTAPQKFQHRRRTRIDPGAPDHPCPNPGRCYRRSDRRCGRQRHRGCDRRRWHSASSWTSHPRDRLADRHAAGYAPRRYLWRRAATPVCCKRRSMRPAIPLAAIPASLLRAAI